MNDRKWIEYDIKEAIIKMLDSSEIKYDLEGQRNRWTFHLPTVSGNEVIISCNSFSNRARISVLIMIDPQIVLKKSNRLLQAVNLINLYDHLKAYLLKDEVVVKCELLDYTEESIEGALFEKLYAIYDVLDTSIVDYAINTDDNMSVFDVCDVCAF